MQRDPTGRKLRYPSTRRIVSVDDSTQATPGATLDFQIFGTITTRSPFDAEERGGIIVPGYLTESRNGYTPYPYGPFLGA